MAEKMISSRISRDLVNLLVDRGMTLTKIAQVLKVSKSYISRVKSASRSFTLDHLVALERAVGEPLPFLLVKAIPADSVSPELRPLYRATLDLLKPKPKLRTRRKRAVAA